MAKLLDNNPTSPGGHGLPQKEITEKAYQAIATFLHSETGIKLGPAKQLLVSSRLGKRLCQTNLDCFDDYAEHIRNSKPSDPERQVAIDLLTTNETYFFREADHFNTLKTRFLQQQPKSRFIKLWSAACSSGEEAYSIAMVMDDYYAGEGQWEILGTDISSQMIARAKKGLYPLHRINAIPEQFLKRYCLKGTGEYQGHLLVEEKLRRKTRFAELNLVKPLPDLGLFDVIFMRNLLIYFDVETRLKITRCILSKLRSGGLLFVGHAESLNGLDLPIKSIATATYQKT